MMYFSLTSGKIFYPHSPKERAEEKSRFLALDESLLKEGGRKLGDRIMRTSSDLKWELGAGRLQEAACAKLQTLSKY